MQPHWASLVSVCTTAGTGVPSPGIASAGLSTVPEVERQAEGAGPLGDTQENSPLAKTEFWPLLNRELAVRSFDH